MPFPALVRVMCNYSLMYLSAGSNPFVHSLDLGSHFAFEYRLNCMICLQIILKTNFSPSIFTISMSCVTAVPFSFYVCKRNVFSPIGENWLSCNSFLTLTDLEPERIIVPIFSF